MSARVAASPSGGAGLQLTVAIGTRPEVIKLAPVVAALRAAGHRVRCVATGQHSDPRLAGDLFTAAGCAPDVVWALPEGEGARVGALLAHAFEEMRAQPPDAVLVVGDTYTAPLLAMAARREGVGVVHLEAGLRSFNERSMEESNRRLLASLATVHLAPTAMAASFLHAEGVDPARVYIVGNPVVDSLVGAGARRVPVADRAGVLLTAHRATNVDDPARLAELASIVERLATDVATVTFPLHPRTRGRLAEAGLLPRLAALDGVHVTEPLPYADLLAALAASTVVVTDSGGLQEEASYLGVPAVVMRSTTPRWEGVASGAAVLTGLDERRVTRAVQRMADPRTQRRIAALPCPYGDGDTARRVVELLDRHDVVALLRPREPELLDRPPARAAS